MIEYYIYFILNWINWALGHAQINSSKAGMSRAELGGVFVSVITISIWTALLCPAPRFSSGNTNRNNTNKHRTSTVLLIPALLLFIWTLPSAQFIQLKIKYI